MITTEAKLPQVRKHYLHQRIVFTVGSYDLLHVGHVGYLEWCATQGDVLVVGVNNSASIARDKGPNRPYVPEQHRVKMVDSLKAVDVTVLTEALLDQPHAESIQTASYLQPDIIVLGHDWGPAEQPYWEQAFPSTKIIICPASLRIMSTTRLIEAITTPQGLTRPASEN